MAVFGLTTAASQTAPYASATTVTWASNVLTGTMTKYSLTYSAQPADVGQFIGVSFWTTNAGKSAAWSGFNDFYLTVQGAGSPPSIVSVTPATATVVDGAAQTLSVTASGAMTYQWQSGSGGVYTNINNNAQFSGATTASLTISNFNTADAANYIVVVGNAGGFTTNDGVNADLPPIVLTANTTLPAITTAPVSATEILGWPATLSVTATTAVTYQWEACATNSTTFTNLANGGIYSGVNSPTLTIANFNSNNVANYAVVVGNGNGSVANDGIGGDAAPATLTLNTNLLYNAMFHLPGTAKIQTGYATIPGWGDTVAAASYTDTGEQAQNTGASITALDPNFASSWEAYTDAGQGGAYQLSHYQIKYGDTITATWFAHTEGGTAGSEDNVGIITAAAQNAAIGAVTTNAVVTNVLSTTWTQYSVVYNSTPADVGNYVGMYFGTMLPNGGTGSWTGFNDFYLTVQGAGAPPTIVSTTPNTSQGAAQVVWGATEQLSVLATPGGVNYQWQSGASGSGIYTNINNDAQFSGANTATLTIANFNPSDAADYVVVVSNAAGVVTNDGLNGDQPVITLQADTGTPYVESTTPATSPTAETPYANITISVSAANTVTYQWESDAGNNGVYTNLLNGAGFSGVNTPNLTINNFNTNDVGDYAVVLTSDAGVADNTGEPITLTLNTNLLYNGLFALPGTGTIRGGFATIPGWANTGGTYDGNAGVLASTGRPGNSGFVADLAQGDGGMYQITGYQMHPGDQITLTWWANGNWNNSASDFPGTGPDDPNQTVTLLSAPARTTPFAGTTTLAVQTNGLTGWQVGFLEYTLTYTAQAADAGNYVGTSTIVRDNSGAAVTSIAWLADYILTVLPAGQPPVILSTTPAHPNPNANPYLGQNQPLSVTAQSATPMTYQWQSDAGQSGVYTNLTNGRSSAG